MSSKIHNPYVGPYPFDRSMKDFFFGRDEEAHRLFYMVRANPLVLFYAQTGAGKSSLIQAKLIPDLEAVGWFVFPVGRVSGVEVKKDEEAGREDEENANPFIANLMVRLLSEAKEGGKMKVPSPILNQRQLGDFFSCLRYPEAGYELALDRFMDEGLVQQMRQQRFNPEDEDEVVNKVLIIDQFEEILTTNLLRWEKRRDFFKQINDLMKRDPDLHIVLVVREEYVPGLIPYAEELESGMNHRFYMQRLDVKGAEDAIQKPAMLFNRKFTPQALANLIDDLRKIRSDRKSIQEAGASSGEAELQNSAEHKDLGQFVDPMILQIFCYQLWEKVGQNPGDITDEYRVQTGGVENALRNFYTDKVTEIAAQLKVGELRLRQWIEKNLISGENRVFVYEGVEKAAGFPDQVWKELENARLIRSAPHEDRKTYELTHDRLVTVIKENNQAWNEEHLTHHQKTALKWHELGERDDGLLLGRKDLKEFKAWMKDPQSQLLGEDLEENYLVKSQKMVNSQNWIISGVVMVILLLFGMLILVNRSAMANREKDILKVEKITQNALSTDQQILLETQGKLSIAQQTQIYEQSQMLTQQVKIDQEQVRLLEETAVIAKTSVAIATISKAQLDLKETAQADAERNALKALSRQLASQGKSYLEENVDLGILLSLAGYQVDPTTWEARSALLAGLSTGSEQKVEPYELMIPTQMELVKDIDISPDGKTVSWCGTGGKIVFWDVADRTTRTLQDPRELLVSSLEFSPTDPNLMVTGNLNSELLFWDLANGTPERKLAIEPDRLGKIRMISFSGNGNLIAVHGENSYIQIWDVTQRKLVRSFVSIANYYWDLDWSLDNRYLAAAGDDNMLYIFDPTSGNIIDVENNPGGNAPIYNVEWSPDKRTLAFGGNTKDAQARLYFYDSSERKVLVPYLEYSGLTILGLAYDFPGGKYLVAAGMDQSVNLWSSKERERIANFSRYRSYQFGLAFVKDYVAFLSDNMINVYKLNIQVPLSTQLPSLPGDPIASGVDEAMNLWSVRKLEDDIYLQNQNEETDYLLGSDVLGNVTLADLYFTPKGPVLITSNEKGLIQQWDTVTQEPVVLFSQDPTRKLTALAVSPDGAKLAISYCEGRTLDQPQGKCSTRILSRDRDRGYAPGRGETILTAPSEYQNLDFSSNGDTLAVSSLDGNINVVDFANNTRSLIVLQATSLALNPDGTILVVGTGDGGLILWDVDANQELGSPLTSSSAALVSLAYAPDGKTLYYATLANNQIISLDVDFDSLFNRLCVIVGRDMTPDEWKQFVPGEPYRSICASVLDAAATPSP